MKKTFPNYKINILLLTFLFICCTKEQPNVIDDDVFIEVYANLLVIQELKISKSEQAVLLQRMLSSHDIALDEINEALTQYQAEPEKWVGILQKVRDRIRVIKKEQLFLQFSDSGAIDQRDNKTANHQDSPQP